MLTRQSLEEQKNGSAAGSMQACMLLFTAGVSLWLAVILSVPFDECVRAAQMQAPTCKRLTDLMDLLLEK